MKVVKKLQMPKIINIKHINNSIYIIISMSVNIYVHHISV